MVVADVAVVAVDVVMIIVIIIASGVPQCSHYRHTNKNTTSKTFQKPHEKRSWLCLC